MPVIYCGNCGHQHRESTKFCQGCGGEIIATDSTGSLMAGVMLDNRYEIIEMIKAGGMGAVYKALDHRFDKKLCAVKEMLNQTGGTSHDQDYMIDRFKKEAHILNELRHPNMPVVRDYFIQAGRYYLVMDYIEGRDLETILEKHLDDQKLLGLSDEKKGLPEEKVIEWAKQILDALDYLHSQKLVYRDLKPSNIILRDSDQRAMLIDFGIARTVNLETIQNTKTATGTPAFAPPELFEGKPEPRTDIYSLAATMHCLLTGDIPFIPFSFKPVRELNSAVSEGLEAIVMQALSHAAKDRYLNAREMKKALEDYTDSCKSRQIKQTPSKKIEEDSESTLTLLKVPTLPGESRPEVTTEEKLARPDSAPAPVSAEKKSNKIKIVVTVILALMIFFLIGTAVLSNTPWYCKYRAENNLKKHKYANARGWYERLIKLNPAMAKSDPTIVENLSSIAEKDPDNAIKCYKAIVSADPDNIEALMALGNGNKEKDPNSAIEYYNKAVAINPKNKDACLALYELYYVKKDYNSAKDILDKPFEPDTLKAGPYSKLGDNFFKGKNYEKAADCYKKVIDIEKGDKKLAAYKNLGKCYINLKDYERAIDVNRDILDLEDTYVQAYIDLGVAYYERKKYEDSFKNLEKALNLKPSREYKDQIVDCLNELGGRYLTKLDYKNAEKAFKKSINIKNSSNARKGLGEIAKHYLKEGNKFLNQKDYDRARKFFNNVLELNTGDKKQNGAARKGLDNIASALTPEVIPGTTYYTGDGGGQSKPPPTYTDGGPIEQTGNGYSEGGTIQDE